MVFMSPGEAISHDKESDRFSGSEDFRARRSFEDESDGSIGTPNNPNWMSQLASNIRINTPINKLIMPGSHDAGSYGIGSNWTTCDVGEAVPWFYRYARRIVSRLARTQAYDIFRQLYLGVRYFDIRLCVKADGQIYVHHGGFVSVNLDDLVQGIAAFVGAYPNEVLILHTQRQFFPTIEEHQKFIRIIKQNGLWNKLADRDQFSPRSTLDEFQSRGKTLILVHDLPPSVDTPLFWKTSSIKNPWANSADLEDTMAFIEDELRQRSFSDFHVFQSVLTPNRTWIERNVLRDPMGVGIAKLSKIINQTVTSRFGSYGSSSVFKHNIILSDMVHYPNLSKTIIESNR